MMIVCDSDLISVEEGGNANSPLDAHFCKEGKVFYFESRNAAVVLCHQDAVIHILQLQDTDTMQAW